MSRPKAPAKKKAPKKKSVVPRKPDGKIDWRKYDKALVERGSITLWIDAEVVSGWVEEPEVKTRGGQRVYSDEAVASVLMVRSVFHLPLRRAEGFCESFFAETGVATCTGSFDPEPSLRRSGCPAAKGFAERQDQRSD